MQLNDNPVKNLLFSHFNISKLQLLVSMCLISLPYEAKTFVGQEPTHLSLCLFLNQSGPFCILGYERSNFLASYVAFRRHKLSVICSEENRCCFWPLALRKLWQRRQPVRRLKSANKWISVLKIDAVLSVINTVSGDSGWSATCLVWLKLPSPLCLCMCESHWIHLLMSHLLCIEVTV